MNFIIVQAQKENFSLFGGLHQCLQDQFKMKPIAYLALLNLPGQNKLKNITYFLGRGDNVVGTNPRCQIVIPQKYQMPNYIANIRIGHNFITMQALHSHLIYVQSNLSKFQKDSQTDNYFLLALSTQYLPKMGQFFFIGRIKAIIGAAPHQDLLLMKNIANISCFAMERQQGNINYLQQSPNKMNEDNRDHFDKMFQHVTLQESSPPRIKDDKQMIYAQRQDGSKMNVNEQPKSHTQVLDQQNYQQQATLVLEEAIYAYQPTINLDYPPEQIQQKSQQMPAYSQEVLMQEIRRQSQVSKSQNNPPQDQNDFSMPDTIVDRDNQAEENRLHIQLVESKEEKMDEEDQMPPTIKENQEPVVNQRIKPAKTMVNSPKDQLIQKRLYNSGPLPKDLSLRSQTQQIKPIEDFMDLFGEMPVSINESALKHHSSEPISQSKDLSLMQISAHKITSLQDKPLLSKKSKKQQQQQQQQQQKQKVHFVGFKPTASHRQFLKKQNLQIVHSPDSQYNILLVKQPLRASNRLLLALIEGKRIQTQQWIFNKQAEIQSKLNGYTWKQIYEKKGTQKLILKGRGRFYVSKRLEELLQNVIQSMGGQVITELTDKKKLINIILRAQDSQDTQLYLKHHENKKWRFLKSQIIVEAVLTGKFTLDQKHIIKLFDS